MQQGIKGLQGRRSVIAVSWPNVEVLVLRIVGVVDIGVTAICLSGAEVVFTMLDPHVIRVIGESNTARQLRTFLFLIEEFAWMSHVDIQTSVTR